MPNLLTSLQGQDLGHFRILSEQWGIELSAPDARRALEQIVPLILSKELIHDVVGALPEDARQALDALAAGGGRLPWARFTQRYGEVRQWGAARRDRERPHLHPVSAAERLWYLALIARANLDTPDGPVEFAYIPDDVLSLLPEKKNMGEFLFGKGASKPESAFPIPADDRILDDGCSLLAALRCNLPLTTLFIPKSFITALFLEGHILSHKGTLNSEEARLFLEMARGNAMRHLVKLWLHGKIDDLRMLPSLEVEGEVDNHPERTRKVILDFLFSIKDEKWWNLSTFIESIKKERPDFQRPTGDYDSWYVRNKENGEFLRGFQHWDSIEGALLRYLIEGPFHWLGLIDLAAPRPDSAVSAFRLSRWAKAFIGNEIPEGFADEDLRVQVNMDGRIAIPRLAGRIVRYQLARFCTWDEYKQDTYHYRLSPAALERAVGQGLTINHLLTLLNNHSLAVPPMLIKALQRWEKQGAEVQIETQQILRSESPEILLKLRKSPAARFLGDALGVNSVLVKKGAATQVLAALADMGILGEIRDPYERNEDTLEDAPYE